MKESVRVVAAALMLLVPQLASAELLVYKGTLKEYYVGESRSLRIGARLFLIVDRETGRVAHLDYASLNGEKQYRTTILTNLHIVQVAGPNGNGYSVLARTKTECETSTSDNEAVFVKGANASLSVSTNQTTSFPKKLSGSGGALFHAVGSDEPVVVDGSFVVAFNKTETFASNNAGETLDAALARLVAFVESLGYTN